MSKFHERVNDLCARLNARQNSRAQSPKGVTKYTKADGNLDAHVAGLMRSMDELEAERIAAAVTKERERCAAIADSMNSTQNIGDRIRYGLGQSKEGR